MKPDGYSRPRVSLRGLFWVDDVGPTVIWVPASATRFAARWGTALGGGAARASDLPLVRAWQVRGCVYALPDRQGELAWLGGAQHSSILEHLILDQDGPWSATAMAACWRRKETSRRRHEPRRATIPIPAMAGAAVSSSGPKANQDDPNVAESRAMFQRLHDGLKASAAQAFSPPGRAPTASKLTSRLFDLESVTSGTCLCLHNVAYLILPLTLALLTPPHPTPPLCCR